MEYNIWLQQYFNIILIFTCSAMVEYAIVNFCSFNYKNRQQQINDSMNLIRANLSKYKKKLQKKIEIYRASVVLSANDNYIGVEPFRTDAGDNYRTETGLMT